MKPFLLKLFAIIVVFVARAGNILKYFFFLFFKLIIFSKVYSIFLVSDSNSFDDQRCLQGGCGIILLNFKPTPAVYLVLSLFIFTLRSETCDIYMYQETN